MTNNTKKVINILVLTLVTFLVLFFSLKDNFNEIIKLIKSINLFYFVIAIMFVFFYWITKSLALNFFIKKVRKIKFTKVFKLTLIVNFINGITPFASGGYPYEVFYLKKQKINVSAGANLAIQNFISYQIALILVGLLAVFLNANFGFLTTSSILKKIILLGFSFNLLITLLLFTLAFSNKFDKFLLKIIFIVINKLKLIKNTDEKYAKINKKIEDFTLGTKQLFSNKIRLLVIILIQMISLICYYLIPYFILKSLGIDSDLVAVAVLTSFVMIIGSLVPIPGGTGGLDYAYILLFAGIVTGSVLQASLLLWRFVSYYLGIIIGLIVYGFKGERE